MSKYSITGNFMGAFSIIKHDSITTQKEENFLTLSN